MILLIIFSVLKLIFVIILFKIIIFFFSSNVWVRDRSMSWELEKCEGCVMIKFNCFGSFFMYFFICIVFKICYIFLFL